MLMGSLRTRPTCENIVERLVTAHRSIHTRWANGIDIDVVGRQFDSKRFDEANNTVLGSDIMSQVCHPFFSSRGRNTNNFAAAAGEHIGNARLARDPHTLENDVDGFIPLLLTQLPARPQKIKASVRYHDIYRTECPVCPCRPGPPGRKQCDN